MTTANQTLQQENANLAEDLTNAQLQTDADNELRAAVAAGDEEIAYLKDAVSRLQTSLAHLTQAVRIELSPLLETVGDGAEA